MQREITAGGRLSIAFSIAWALAWFLVFLFWGSPSSTLSEVGRSVCGLIIMALSFPLGCMSDVIAKTGPSISPGGLVGFLILSGGNFFLLGYGLVGIWRLFWRVFGPFPPVEYERISKAREALADVEAPPESEERDGSC